MFLAIFLILAVNNVASIDDFNKTGDHDLSGWFSTPSKFSDERQHLVKAINGTLTITGAIIMDIGLPALKEVDHLVITNIQGAKNVYLPALETATSITIKKSQLVAIHLGRLKHITNLTIVSNAQLSSVDIGELETVEQLIYAQNKNVSFERFKWFHNGEKLSIGDRNQSRVECYLSETDVIRSADFLKPCTHIYGQLTIKGPDFVGNGLAIKELHGCLVVENTQLKNLDFLKDTLITDCKKEHRLAENTRMCPAFHENTVFEKLEKSGKVTAEGPRDVGCYVRACSTGKELGCSEFLGDLVIDDQWANDNFRKLKTIKGSLQITTIRLHQEVSLPRLERIIGQTGPLVIIYRNYQLEAVKIRRLKELTARVDNGRTPMVSVWGNSHDIIWGQGFLEQTCSQTGNNSKCHIQGPQLEPEAFDMFSDFTQNFWIGVSLWAGLIVVLYLGSWIWYGLIWREERRYWQGIEETKMKAKQEMYQQYREKRQRRRTKFWRRRADENKKKTISTWQMSNNVKHITL